VTEHGRLFWIALVVGWAVMGVGAVVMLTSGGDANPLAVVPVVVGFAVLHDAVLAPLAFVAFWWTGRHVPSVARGPVRGALALTVVLTLFALPLVGRFGARATNDSALPLDYGRNLALLLALVWAAAVVVIVVRRARQAPARAPR
jgi:hypothetical protein